ncbi:MAG: 30S ribosomal protein S5 [Planctomycetota bacterium]
MTEENKSPAEEPAESADAGSAEAAPAPEKEAPAAEAPAEAPAKSEDAPAEAAPPRENTGRPGGGRGGPGGGRGGPGGGRGGRGGGRRGRDDGGDSRYEERVVKINRCSKVIKGGRRFSFSALVVLGDREGSVGIGFGKANEVPPSVEKAMKIARNDFTKVSIHGNTIPHKIVGSYRSSRVVMLPATEGTGIIAGAPVRAVVECAGVKDLLTKVHGSTNPLNVVKATMNGLKQLRTREEVSMLRGVEIPE